MKELTSEKYLKKTENIYALVVVASKRAASLTRGSKSLIPEAKNLKAPVIALEEIIEGKIEIAPPPESDAKKK